MLEKTDVIKLQIAKFSGTDIEENYPSVRFTIKLQQSRQCGTGKRTDK